MTEARKHRYRAKQYGLFGTVNDLTDAEIAIAKAQGCAFCGTSVAQEIDHLEPLAQGGPNRIDNVRGCCADCNREKGNRVPDVWGKQPSTLGQMGLPGMPDKPGYDWRSDHD